MAHLVIEQNPEGLETSEIEAHINPVGGPVSYLPRLGVLGIFKCQENRIHKAGCARCHSGQYLELFSARKMRYLIRIVDRMIYLSPHFFHERPNLNFAGNCCSRSGVDYVMNARV